MNKKPENSCTVTEGSLPGSCASLAFPYIPLQTSAEETYKTSEGLQCGTLFPGLNLPFQSQMQRRFPDIPAPMAELMALDFSISELGLYLDTHPTDQEALELMHTYIRLAKQGRDRYQEKYGPLEQTYISKDGYPWVNDPWPWEKEAEK